MESKKVISIFYTIAIVVNLLVITIALITGNFNKIALIISIIAVCIMAILKILSVDLNDLKR